MGEEGSVVKTITFYADEDDVRRIEAEQDHFGDAGIRISPAEAIRSLMRRAAENLDGPAAVAENGGNGAKGMKFLVLPSEKVLHQRVEKVFRD